MIKYVFLASRISCDEDGVTVVHFSNTLDITVIWRVSGHSKRETDDKQGFDDKEFYEKYAIQLGEVKHVPPPVGLQLVKANVTVVESVSDLQASYLCLFTGICCSISLRSLKQKSFRSLKEGLFIVMT